MGENWQRGRGQREEGRDPAPIAPAASARVSSLCLIRLTCGGRGGDEKRRRACNEDGAQRLSPVPRRQALLTKRLSRLRTRYSCAAACALGATDDSCLADRKHACAPPMHGLGEKDRRHLELSSPLVSSEPQPPSQAPPAWNSVNEGLSPACRQRDKSHAPSFHAMNSRA